MTWRGQLQAQGNMRSARRHAAAASTSIRDRSHEIIAAMDAVFNGI